MVTAENRIALSQYSESEVAAMLDLTSTEEARFQQETQRAFNISANLFPVWDENNGMQNFKNLSGILLHLDKLTKPYSKAIPFRDRYSEFADKLLSSLSPRDKDVYDGLSKYLRRRLQFKAPTPISVNSDRQIPASFIRSAQLHLSRHVALSTIDPRIDSPFSVLADYYDFGGGPLVFSDLSGSPDISGHIVIRQGEDEALACFTIFDQGTCMKMVHSWSDHLPQAAS